MAVSAKPSAPPSTLASTSWRWARANLFSSPGNAALTVITSAVIGLVLLGFDPRAQLGALVQLEWPDLLGGGLLRFVFDSAEWGVIEANRRLFFVGRFPVDETWRVWVVLYLVSGLAGASVGLWATISWRLALPFVVGLVAVFLFISEGMVLLWTAGTVGLFGLSYAAGRTLIAPRGFLPLARNLVVLGWLGSFLLTMYLLSAVDTLLWGGLLLTIILTVVGIVASFPIGVLLALGRQSTFPVIRLFCVGYIEMIRGVPLITLLFMAFFFLPLMVGPERNISFLGIAIPVTGFELDVVTRAMVAITLFSAAYLAETVRGGLQAVPRGQIEAAQALGLGTVRILALIVLPQALRAVIPAIVGQFISLFKDTSLVAILALTELLGTARQVTAQRAFFGTQAEVLLFVALIYWIIAFSMSRASQQLEHTLGVGER